jgi:hypothetical protein
MYLKCKSDEELLNIFKDYNKSNNTRKNCKRAVNKFREFIKVKY